MIDIDRLDNIFDDITEELKKAMLKFPECPVDPLHAVAIIGEEFGELTKAILQRTYEPEEYVTIDEIYGEAIQVSAMVARFLLNMEQYRYRKSDMR